MRIAFYGNFNKVRSYNSLEKLFKNILDSIDDYNIDIFIGGNFDFEKKLLRFIKDCRSNKAGIKVFLITLFDDESLINKYEEYIIFNNIFYIEDMELEKMEIYNNWKLKNCDTILTYGNNQNLKNIDGNIKVINLKKVSIN